MLIYTTKAPLHSILLDSGTLLGDVQKIIQKGFDTSQDFRYKLHQNYTNSN